MTKPPKPTVPPAPSRANPGTEFSTRADTFAAFQTTFADYLDATAEFVDGRANDALAAALGGSLPSLAGQAGRFLRVNTSGTAAEFSSIPDSDNRIINGAFDFWQRGVNTGVNGAYAADRWRNTFLGAGASQTHERQAFPVGTKLGRCTPEFFLRVNSVGVSGTTPACITQQFIEDVRVFSGERITLLGWVRRVSGSGNLAFSFNQVFGSGGSPSQQVTVPGQLLTPTTGWAPFALVYDIPSVAGQTFGTNENSSALGLQIFSSAGTSYPTSAPGLGVQSIQFDLWGLHILPGQHSVEAVDLFKIPEKGPEFDRCLRYYAASSMVEAHMVPAPASSFSSIHHIPFRVRMRRTPAITTQYTQLFQVSSTSVFRTGVDGFQHQTVAALNTNALAEFNWQADIEF